MSYAVLVVNGYINNIDYYKDIIQNCKLLVCCDGGANFLKNTSFKVDLIVGDLDSIDKDTLQKYMKEKTLIKKYPTKKNKTDSELAIDIIKSKKIDNIIMIAAFGDRIDHMLSNINLLYYAKNIGLNLSILDENNEISLLSQGEHKLNAKIGQTVSFVSISGQVKGITLKGFEYDIQNYDLQDNSSILTSNIVKKENIFIFIEKGSLLFIKINKI